MSKKILKDAKDANIADKASEVAKSIWLAGLGAYGKAFDEAVTQYGKVSKETSKVFDDLVELGRKLDSESQAKLSNAKNKTTATIEDRINKVRSSVNMSSLNFAGADNAKIDEVNAKVDALSDKLDALLDSMAVAKPKAAAAKAK
ncbi:MAG TPA: phasin family protein [Pseudomonadales bacterium]|jgi:polyhydroxyalkanoate synthesis regulator phasin|nr:phasin family protein [Cellvibrionales bacterium]HRF87356.1 phasin family protein [Pseudomonadales bacterium]